MKPDPKIGIAFVCAVAVSLFATGCGTVVKVAAYSNKEPAYFAATLTDALVIAGGHALDEEDCENAFEWFYKGATELTYPFHLLLLPFDFCLDVVTLPVDSHFARRKKRREERANAQQ